MSASWKAEERRVAALVGSTRNPNTGQPTADIDTPAFAYQVKKRRAVPAWLTEAVDQARGDAHFGRTGVVVVSHVRPGVKARRFVVLDFEDWLEWHGPTATPPADPVERARQAMTRPHDDPASGRRKR